MSTWNSSDKTSGITLGSSNTEATSSASGQQAVRGTASESSGQLYFEVKMAAISTSFTAGLANSTFSLSGTVLGADGNGVAFYPTHLTCILNGTTEFSNASHSDVSQYVVGFAVDLSNKKLWITSSEMQAVYGSSAWNNSSTASPSSGTGGIDISGISGALFPCFSTDNNGDVAYLRTSTGFSFTIPTGFLAWDSASSSPVTWTTKNASTSMTLDSTSLIATSGTPVGVRNQTIFANTALPNSKVYFEGQISGEGNITGSWLFGIANSSFNIASSMTGVNAATYRPYSLTGFINSAAKFVNRAASDAVNNYIGVAVDVPNGLIWFTSDEMVTTYGSNSWNDATSASQNPSTGTGGYSISALGSTLFAAFNCQTDSGNVCSLNPGSSTFHFTTPTGFSAYAPSSISPPGQVTGLTASSPTSSSINLAWTAPSSGGTVSGYDIETSPDGSTWGSPLAVGNVTSYTYTGLASGTLVYFRVAAFNGGGTGAWSSSTSDTTTAALPGIVQGFEGTSSTTTSITLGWTALSGAAGYLIESSLTGQAPWVDPAATVSGGTSTSATISGLHSGTTYYFQIAGTNSSGPGPWSNYPVSYATTTATSTGTSAVPGQVALPTTTPLSSTEIRVSWAAPGSGGTPTNYYIKHMATTDTAFSTSTVTSTATSYTLTGLQESTPYNFSVFAGNSAGNGAPSTVAQQWTLRDFIVNPGADGSFAVAQFATTADWITTGAAVTALRNGVNSSPTGHIHLPSYVNGGDGFLAPFWVGRSTDPSVTIKNTYNGANKSVTVNIPLGAGEEAQDVNDTSIGGACFVGGGYLAWNINGGTINTGTISASGSVITSNNANSGSPMTLEDASGQYLVDAVTNVQGGMNSMGNITDYDLTRCNADPNFVIQHKLQYLLDPSQCSTTTPGIWPLNVVDTSLGGSGPITQGYTIGIPKTTTRPTGMSRGFYVLFDALQKGSGAFFYNVSSTGCTSFCCYPAQGNSANIALAEDIANNVNAVMAYVCLLSNQTSTATVGGMQSGGAIAFPGHGFMNGDLLPSSNANVNPTSTTWGGWYDGNAGGTLTYQTTPSNTANPT